jgi:oligo-1,6-glucosidase/alpha-glucosidase
MKHERSTAETADQWWKKTTVYQIYPRSFQDRNGDGIGDLRGIISRLDYVQQLGFETIWISPFFRSPQRDLGYDISDYYSIAPEYGTMEDFRELIRQVHSRNMKLVLDMVLNHTSDEHEWFRESASSRDNPKRNWYVWRDGRKPGGKAPPNNWTSMVSGRGWHYHTSTDQWYWASFLPFQPDLNYRNPEVKEEMFRMLRFWLGQGVDGFRLDIIGSVYEDPDFRDNPPSCRLVPNEANEGFLFRSTKMTQNHPDNFEFARELRALIDEFRAPPRFLVGETFGKPELLRRYCGREQPDGLNLVFLFKTMSTPFRAGAIRRMITEFEEHFPEPFMPTYVFSNHDRARRFSRLGGDLRKIKLNTVLQFTARGVPFTYYGEEIGMQQGSIPPKESRDAVAHHMGTSPAWILRLLNRLTAGAVQRDGCRTPMQWSAHVCAGFTDGAAGPWLPVNKDYTKINVETQIDDPDSLLACYRRLIALRREYPALHSGTLRFLPAPPSVLAYERAWMSEAAGKTEKILILLNFSGRRSRPIVPTSGLELLFSTGRRPVEVRPAEVRLTAENGSEEPLPEDQQNGDRKIRLGPWEGCVFLRS